MIDNIHIDDPIYIKIVMLEFTLMSLNNNGIIQAIK